MELLFVCGADDTETFQRFHRDLIGVYGVRDVTDPPLETGLGVLAHKQWLHNQNNTKITYYVLIMRQYNNNVIYLEKNIH